MAEQLSNIPPCDPELARLLLQGIPHATEAELREQRISFAYGNAPAEATTTKASVRRAAAHIRLLAIPRMPRNRAIMPLAE